MSIYILDDEATIRAYPSVHWSVRSVASLVTLLLFGLDSTFSMGKIAGASPIRVRGPWHELKVPCSIGCKLTSRFCYLQLPYHSALVLQEFSSFVLISNLHPVRHFRIVYTHTREHGSRRFVFTSNHLSYLRQPTNRLTDQPLLLPLVSLVIRR